ncbi:RHS repeat-associated core domain-containing protein [Amycolatopsis sp. 195334CR]|uniref:RHS repeat-associated core domain-containing protein n=1 Tax=Amycolatopsis sp. 195334CR TaxID=2814588 RepID=UPI001A8D5503|nr:RHS repeat-associated core domain-containing protein [Amycolatopsis sp. 195334CR]MBN6041093.1 RHS repeat protein [Amycolatopsis sp. 195334CR]
MANPLVAEVQDSTTAISGVPILESINETSKAIESGDWAAGVLGAAGTALDALGMAMDPFGSILAAGVGWLIEHCGPLSDALDALTGNPDEIKAHSETWKNVGTELSSISADLAKMIEEDTASWTGPAGDAYRTRGADIATLITGAQSAAEGASSGIGTAGEVVGAVRSLVRDIIAELVGHMISWALQVLFTLGIGLAWVVPQVVSAVAKTAMKIADITKKLVQALSKLSPLLKKLGDSFGDAAKALKNIKSGNQPKPETTRGGGGDTSPSSSGPTPNPPPGQSNNGGGGGGDTTSSSAKPDGSSGTPPPPAPKPDPTPNPTPTPTPSPTPTPTPTPRSPEPSTANGKGGSRNDSVEAENRNCKSDPVDIATGEVVMTQLDLTIAGQPDLLLERTHVSSYREGRWFGPSWASTLDQRVEVGGAGITYFSADGMKLVYPRPAGGEVVLPAEGPRWPLSRTADGYRLGDRTARRTLVFTTAPGQSDGVMPLTAIEYEAAPRVTVEYAANGAPSTIRRADGHEVRLASLRGRIVEMEAVNTADGTVVPVVRFGYNEAGHLTQVINSSGRPMTFDYDPAGRLTGWQDRTGTWYRYVYDHNGRCVQTVGADGFYDGRFTYDTEARVTTYTDALGHRSEYRLNNAGQLVEETDPLGHTRKYSWDRYDRMLSRTDELGRITRYTYTDDGELAEIIRPDGSALRVSAAADGAVSLEARDARREYPADDAPDLFTTSVGAAVPFRADGRSSPLDEAAVHPAVGGAPGERDLFGRPRVARTGSGAAVRHGWTVEGNRTVRTGPLGRHETWQYDAEGNAIEHRGAAGQVTRRTYGPFGLPTAEIDPAGGRTTYAYDGELRLIAVTNPAGRTWRYTYDPAGRLIAEEDFDGRRLSYTYDAAGQLLSMTNALGEVTEYRYDVLGNVVERRTAAGTTTYSYDSLGQLERATNQDSVLDIVRDEYGRVTAEAVNGLGISWDYDENAVHRRTPSGIDSTWVFDGAGRPELLTTSGREVRFEYDAAGREIGRYVDGSAVLRQSFDEQDQLTEQVLTAGDRVLKQRRYHYRVDGELIAIDDSTTGAQRFRLDTAGRVTEVSAQHGTERYAYDACGNLTSATTPWSEYDHDGQGRVVSRYTGGAVWRFSWDPLDRMTDLTAPDGTRWTYLYDPLGRRFAKQRWTGGADGVPVMTDETRFVWSGPELVEQLTQRHDGSKSVLTWERHPLDGRAVAQSEYAWPQHESRFHSIVTNPVGTPTELLGDNGDIVWEARTSIWGVTWPSRSVATTPLRFPGQYHDDESGLHYNVYRYYDPTAARYLSQDPLGLRPAPNPVAYVASPLLAADPLGLAGTGKCGGSNGAPNRDGTGNDAGHIDRSQPKPDGNPGNGKGLDLRNLSEADYYKLSPQLKELLKTDPNGAWFWSGGRHDADGKWNSVMDTANDTAKRNDGTTLEAKLDSNKITMPNWKDEGPFNKPIWDDASAAFARNAKGDVHAILVQPGKDGPIPENPTDGIARRTDNVFDMTEFPILRHNPNVDRIFTHDVVFDQNTKTFVPLGTNDLLWENPNRPKPKL